MVPLYWTMILHFIGLGMLFTSLFAGWILNTQYRKGTDWKAKSLILRALRPVGLLSPIGAGVMLLSGAGNIAAAGYGWPLPLWLHTKLLFFAALLIAGIFAGVRGKARGILVQKLADGNPPQGAETVLAVMDRQAGIMLALQAILLLAIVTISVVKS